MRFIISGLFALGAYVIGSCVGPDAVASYVSRIIFDNSSSAEIALSCLNGEIMAQVRKARSVTPAFPPCKEELRSELGHGFSAYDDEALKAILATVAASRFADYGSSNAISYDDIAASQFLNCGNTILLAGFLLDQGDRRIRPIGFDGGAVGNHAQLFYLQNDDPDEPNDLLLDPTYGLVAITSLNNLLSGKKVDGDQIRRFAIKDRSIGSVQDGAFKAIVEGRYRPSDFMYLHRTVADMYTSANLDNYFTPAGIYLREKMAAGGAK